MDRRGGIPRGRATQRGNAPPRERGEGTGRACREPNAPWLHRGTRPTRLQWSMRRGGGAAGRRGGLLSGRVGSAGVTGGRAYLWRHESARRGLHGTAAQTSSVVLSGLPPEEMAADVDWSGWCGARFSRSRGSSGGLVAWCHRVPRWASAKPGQGAGEQGRRDPHPSQLREQNGGAPGREEARQLEGSHLDRPDRGEEPLGGEWPEQGHAKATIGERRRSHREGEDRPRPRAQSPAAASQAFCARPKHSTRRARFTRPSVLSRTASICSVR